MCRATPVRPTSRRRSARRSSRSSVRRIRPATARGIAPTAGPLALRAVRLSLRAAVPVARRGWCLGIDRGRTTCARRSTCDRHVGGERRHERRLADARATLIADMPLADVLVVARRLRVPLGFACATLAFWLARPTPSSFSPASASPSRRSCCGSGPQGTSTKDARSRPAVRIGSCVIRSILGSR